MHLSMDGVGLVDHSTRLGLTLGGAMSGMAAFVTGMTLALAGDAPSPDNPAVTIILALLGSGGLGGTFFYLVKRWADNSAARAAEERALEREADERKWQMIVGLQESYREAQQQTVLSLRDQLERERVRYHEAVMREGVQ